MKYKLQKIGIKSFVLVASVISAVFGLFMGAAVSLITLFNPSSQEAGDVWAVFLFPVFNAVLGAAVSFILAYAYNLFAKWFGGIEIECEEAC